MFWSISIWQSNDNLLKQIIFQVLTVKKTSMIVRIMPVRTMQHVLMQLVIITVAANQVIKVFSVVMTLMSANSQKALACKIPAASIHLGLTTAFVYGMLSLGMVVKTALLNWLDVENGHVKMMVYAHQS